LKKKGLLNYSHGGDIKFDKNRLKAETCFVKILPKPIGDTKVMVMFDIPERHRKVRNWLRSQLRLWGFEMLQQSVWLGTGSLPSEFLERLDLLGVRDAVKIFKMRNIKLQQ